MDMLEYSVKANRYGMRITEADFLERRPLLLEIISRAHSTRV